MDAGGRKTGNIAELVLAPARGDPMPHALLVLALPTGADEAEHDWPRRMIGRSGEAEGVVWLYEGRHGAGFAAHSLWADAGAHRGQVGPTTPPAPPPLSSGPPAGFADGRRTYQRDIGRR